MTNATVAARGNPKIHLVFSQDLNGMFVLLKAEATQEEEVLVPEPVVPTPAPKKNATALGGKNATAGAANGTNATAAAEEAAEDKADAASSNSTGVEAANGTNATAPAPKMKLVKNTLRFPLNFTLNVTGAYPVAPLTQSEIAAVLTRFGTLKAEDDKKRMVETAKSECEATVYKFRDDMEAQEEQLKKVTTAEQREDMSGAISGLTLWLEEDGASATYDEYKAKTAEFRGKMAPAFSRSSELAWRPKAVKAAQDEISHWRELTSKWNETHPQVRELFV
jgi:molecular chaperone DnaK (HSP70)